MAVASVGIEAVAAVASVGIDVFAVGIAAAVDFAAAVGMSGRLAVDFAAVGRRSYCLAAVGHIRLGLL